MSRNFSFSDLLRGRKEIDSLLSRISKLEKSKRSTDERLLGGSSEKWLSPLERRKSLLFFPGTQINSANFETLITLTDLQGTLLSAHGLQLVPSIESPRVGRCLLDLGRVTFISSAPVCPTEKLLKTRLEEEATGIAVHSFDGYSFSAEYEHVYRSNPTAATAFADFVAVCKRALLVEDPTMDDNKAGQFAVYMGRMAMWEAAVANAVCSENLKVFMPSLQAEVVQEPLYVPLKIFIGKSGPDNILSFWVRYCPLINSILLKGPPQAGAQAVDKVAEGKAEKSLRFCYCRRFSLTVAAIAELDARGFADPSSGVDRAPPPPPKPPAPDDLRVLLECSQNGNASSDRVSLDAYGDVNEEELLHVANSNSNLAGRAMNGAGGGDSGSESGRSNHSLSASSSRTSRNRSSKARGRGMGLSGIGQGWATAAGLDIGPSPSAELLGWGHEHFACLGMGETDRIFEPRPVPIPSSLALERVQMIACSPRHTLILTLLGNVYCCGENVEGALGTGDIKSRQSLTLLQWPPNPLSLDSPPPKIVKIAAGAGNIGAHSMAIASDGKLYGWGKSYAVGLGGTKPVLSPSLIDTFPKPPRQDVADVRHVDEDGDDDDDEVDAPVLAALRCKDVACGGGFTIAVLRSGRVCSWGMWTHGRLGLGPAPLVTSRRSKSSGTKAARYQLRPAVIRGLFGVEAVSCGEAHTLCLLEGGEVRAWGQNTCGQLGLGLSPAGFFHDSSRPVPVPPFVASPISGLTSDARSDDGDIWSTSVANDMVRAKLVCAGAYHSIVVDARGDVWTWGARGSACLGHADAMLEGTWGSRINTVFSLSKNDAFVMLPYELKSWCSRWAYPRRVESLLGIPVSQVSAGDLHTAFVTTAGHLFVCGSGPVAPPIASVSLKMEESERLDANSEDYEDEEEDNGNDGDDDDDNDDDINSNLDKEEDTNTADDAAKRRQKARRRRKRVARAVSEKASLVSSPRCASVSWLAGLSGKRTLLVASSGTRCFALQDEEAVAVSLMVPLLQKTLLGSGAQVDQEALEEASLDSYVRSEEGSVGSYFEQRGKADCMIIASGKVVLAHRAILSQRSPELRDMIADEMPTDGDVGQPTQLLLPELHADAAKAMVSFLYTDVLPRNCMGNISLLQSLLRCARSLRIPRLQILCERVLNLLDVAQKARNDADLIATQPILDGDLPPATLARDLGSLVGDPSFADVRFIAEGKPILAHRFILESRCEYFRAMFRSSMAEGFEAGNSEPVDVVVPDTFMGFLRLLIFLYTNTLPDGSDEALLEDIMCADRYDIADMKLLCESMLVPSETNWLDLLHVAEALGSLSLQIQVEAYLRDNFDALRDDVEDNVDDFSEGAGPHSSGSSMRILREQYPGLLARLLDSRREAFPAPPCQILIAQVHDNAKTKQLEINSSNSSFPIFALCAAVVSIYIYAQVANVVALGPLVPIVNIICTIALIWFVLNRKSRFFS